MEGIINYLWEGSICLFLLYGFYRIFLSDHTFFEWNRTYLMLTIGLVLIIPLMNIPVFLHGAETVLSKEYIYFMPEFEMNAASENSSNVFPSLFSMVAWIYIVGVMIAFVRFIIGLYQIFSHIKMAEKIQHEGFTIAIHPDFQPSSYFNFIFLPEYLPSDHGQQLIISHEINHAGRYHSLDILFFQLLKIIFWFHPFTKMMESSISEVHEYQVDHEITKTCAKTEYANLLLHLILADQGKQLMNNYFNKFQTKKRIMMMAKTKSNPIVKSRFLLAVPLLALLVIAFACGQQEDHELVLEEDLSGDLVLKSSSDDIFDIVEEPPMPVGGFDAWTSYLSSNLTYPAQAKKEGIEGTVYVVFVVEVDGSIQGAKILRGIGGGCDEEALRIIQNAPDWEPGVQKGQKVNCRMRVPIKFQLSANT